MPKIEVFFDYACPYCLRGHEYLTQLLPKNPHIEVEWHPCEAHPRPERYGRHSDLCARGMFFALDNGADLMEYHRRMYRAAITDRADIENVKVLSTVLDGLLKRSEWERVLSGDLYSDRLLDNNRLAWDIYNFPAVPSYRMEGKTLLSIPDVGVSKGQLAAFMR